MILCDLCGEAKECLLKEIEGREYDVCKQCWQPIEAKLRGKGRVRRRTDPVYVPATTPEPTEPPFRPGLPPKIIANA